jgi:hypothetical protein
MSRYILRLLCAAGAALPLGGCVTHEVNQYLGANPRIVFNSINMVDQTTMQFDESKPGVDWGLSLAWMGDHYLLTADQNTTPGKPTQVWQIVALQEIPLLRQGEMLALGTCRKWGLHQSRVTAIVKYQGDQQWFDQIQAAWIYDYRRNSFEDYPTAHLECLNPRYGLGLDKPPASSTVAAPAAVSQGKPTPKP